MRYSSLVWFGFPILDPDLDPDDLGPDPDLDPDHNNISVRWHGGKSEYSGGPNSFVQLCVQPKWQYVKEWDSS